MRNCETSLCNIIETCENCHSTEWQFFGFIHERITEGGRPVSEIFAKKIDFLIWTKR